MASVAVIGLGGMGNRIARLVEAARSWLDETDGDDRDYSAVLERITRR